MDQFHYHSIGNVIKSNVYYIPDYQREYSWTISEVEDFWYDLENLITEEYDSHFLGQIVVHKDTESNPVKKYIIDGQQRLSTIFIFISAVRNILKEFHKQSPNEDVETDIFDIEVTYLGIIKKKTEGVKIHLGKNDREYFKNNILISEPPKTKDKLPNSHLRIKVAYNYFYDRLKGISDGKLETLDKVSIIKKYLDSVVNKFHATYIETSYLNEAFIIFETLNARGMDLETSDLLKNHLFRTANSHIGTVKDKWELMSNDLANIDKTKFIRHYWNSFNQFTREKDLYKRIRDSIDDPKKSIELVTSLWKLSKIYAFLTYPKNEVYFPEPVLTECFQNLSIMNAKSYIPLVLALETEEFSHTDIFEISKTIEILVFRNLTICGKNPNEYEVFFAKTAKDITGKKLNGKKEIIEILQKQIVDDEFFGQFFEVYMTKNKDLVRYIFQKINNSQLKTTKIIDNNNLVHIEHVMPETLGDWKVDQNEHEEYLWRLGNLTLLYGPDNSSIKNTTFNLKKAKYIDSELFITQEIACYETWTSDSIIKRQKLLANIAKKVWRI